MTCPACHGTGTDHRAPALTRWMRAACGKCWGSGWAGPRRIALIQRCSRYGNRGVTEVVRGYWNP